MYYGFETSNENAGIAALLVYGTYRSRDVKRFKVSPDMWGQIERAVKSSAKRALDLTDFLERLKPKLHCSSLKPSAMTTDPAESKTITMAIDRETGELIQKEELGRREFWVTLLDEADDEAVLEILYKKTSLVIALVRDRLEREKALREAGIIDAEEVEDEEDSDERIA